MASADYSVSAVAMRERPKRCRLCRGLLQSPRLSRILNSITGGRLIKVCACSDKVHWGCLEWHLSDCTNAQTIERNTQVGCERWLTAICCGRGVEQGVEVYARPVLPRQAEDIPRIVDYPCGLLGCVGNPRRCRLPRCAHDLPRDCYRAVDIGLSHVSLPDKVCP